MSAPDHQTTASGDDGVAPAPYGGLAPMPAVPAYGYQPPAPHGPAGKVRGTGLVILLTIVTFGIYSLYWFYATHDEIHRHSGRGVGGGIGLLIALLAGIISAFILPKEIGELYEARGETPPVGAVTGLWYVLGALIIIGPLVWLVKTNGALNNYWRSLGAR